MAEEDSPQSSSTFPKFVRERSVHARTLRYANLAMKPSPGSLLFLIEIASGRRTRTPCPRHLTVM